MEGVYPNVGGSSQPSSANPVPQIPAEYDDLYMQQGPYADQRDFSQDINKRMKMPNRLSVDGHNLHDLEMENMRANASSSQMAAAGMAIPEKITLTGSGQRDVLDDQYSFMNAAISSESQSYVNITTPPRVLTVDERFPIVEDEPEPAGRHGGVNIETVNKIRAMDLDFSPQKLASAPIRDYSATEADSLNRRLAVLEARERQRHTRELIFYPIVAIYFGLKFFNWMMGR